MSGSIMQFAPVAPIDPLAGQQRLADLGYKQAQTGLIGQQTQAADIQNRFQQARLGPLIDAYQGTSGGGAIGAASGAGGPPPITTGPGGEIMSGPFSGLRSLPAGLALSIKAAPPEKWGEEMSRINGLKKQLIGQYVSDTIGPDGHADPAAWDQMVTRAYADGLMDSVQRAQLLGHPEAAQRIISSLAPAEQQPGFKYAQERAGGLAHAETTVGETSVPGPEGGRVPVKTSNAAILGLLPAGQPGGSPLAQKVRQYENGTGNPAQANASGPGGSATSSAVGDHQWTQETWMTSVQKYAPELLEGRTRQQVLDLRKDPDLSAAMFDARAPELAQAAASAVPNGQGTDAAVGLAHFLGAAGARTLINAPPDALFKDVLPAAARANPTYANMTTAQVAAQFAKRYGTQPFSSSPATPAAVGAPGVSQAGPETFSEPQKINMERVKSYQDDLTTAATAARTASATLQQAEREAQGFTSGPFAPFKMKGLQYLNEIANNVNAMVGKKVIPAPDQSVGDWEAFNKNMLLTAGAAVKAMAPRVTNFEFGTFQKIMPSDTTSPVGRQLVFDQMLGLNDYLQAKNDMAAKMKAATTNPSQFEAEWNKSVAPEAFIIHRMNPAAWQEFKASAAKSPETWSKLQGWVRQAGNMERLGLFPAAAQ